MLFHISKDIELKKKEFIPRIPQSRLLFENNTIPRICMSTKLEHCISSSPYGNDLKQRLRQGAPCYLMIYTYNDKEHILKPTDVVKYVEDAEVHQEHWVTKSFSSKPELIRIKELDFSGFCKYTGNYKGLVTHFSYEKTIESVDRKETTLFYHKKHFRSFKRACERHGIIINKIETSFEKMRYGISFDLDYSSRSFKTYRVHYTIPKGKDASHVWIWIQKELVKNTKKYVIYQDNDFL